MTWAARYSRTEQPELTIYRDGLEFAYLDITNLSLVTDLLARIPATECIQTDACRNHAVDGQRCWEHGGSDPL